MQRVNVCKAVLVTVAMGCCLVNAQAKPDKAFWVGQYRKIEQLMDKQDTKTFAAMLDKDFYLVDPKGKKMTRAEFIDKELGTIAKAITSNNDVKVTGVTQTGKQVNVSYDWRSRLGLYGPPHAMTVASREIGTDTWEKKNGRWVTVKTVVKTATTKPVGGGA